MAVRLVLSQKTGVRFSYAALVCFVHRVGKPGIPRPSGGRDRWFESNRGDFVLSANFLGVAKFGIARRLGRRDRWFESSHLGSGATSQLAMALVSKTSEPHGLIGSTPIRSARNRMESF